MKDPKQSILEVINHLINQHPDLAPIVADIARKAQESGDGANFLSRVKGVIHVGANVGQERQTYDSFGLAVIWVEPIPGVFEQLQQNIAAFPRQRAFKELLTDEKGKSYEFKVANNNGVSSSIFDLGLHQDIWPQVQFTNTITVVSNTLAEMLKEQAVNVADYDALVMDTQGSELLVLKGAGGLVRQFKYIKTEAADFESYVGCCQVQDLSDYLAKFGFREMHRKKFAERKQGGCYYDILYERAD